MIRNVLMMAVLATLAACANTDENNSTGAAASVDVVESSRASASVAASTANSAHALDAILASPHRDAANKARDIYRHPKETLDFFGVTPTTTVIEITPGGGWYTEILGPYLRDSGKSIAAIWDDAKPGAPGYYKRNNDILRAKVAAHAAQLDRVELRAFDPKAPNFGATGSVDAVVTFRNVHNWTMDGSDAAFFKAFFDVVKPGGVLGVVEHRANAGTTLEATKESGYLTEDYVIGLATAAGFALEAKSEVNANARDSKDHPEGVWTLPPSLALKDKDREKYVAIGESDRMTLRFRKPGADTLLKTSD